MGTAAAIGLGLQLASDALGVISQLNAGQLTDAQALQLLVNACNSVTGAINTFNAEVAKVQGTAPAPAAGPPPAPAP